MKAVVTSELFNCVFSTFFCVCIYLSLCLYHQSGLTPLHLAAQDDKVNVAEVLVNQGATVDPETKVMLPLKGWNCLTFWVNITHIC